jgi:hypothetical protein
VGLPPYPQNNPSSSPSPQTTSHSMALGICAGKTLRISMMVVTPISGAATTQLGSPAWRTPAGNCPMMVMTPTFAWMT